MGSHATTRRWPAAPPARYGQRRPWRKTVANSHNHVWTALSSVSTNYEICAFKVHDYMNRYWQNNVDGDISTRNIMPSITREQLLPLDKVFNHSIDIWQINHPNGCVLTIHFDVKSNPIIFMLTLQMKPRHQWLLKAALVWANSGIKFILARVDQIFASTVNKIITPHSVIALVYWIMLVNVFWKCISTVHWPMMFNLW